MALVKCDDCGENTEETETESCLGYRFHCEDVLSRLMIEKSPKQLRNICPFEGGNFYCKNCIDSHGFCKTCQKESTAEERKLIAEDY